MSLDCSGHDGHVWDHDCTVGQDLSQDVEWHASPLVRAGDLVREAAHMCDFNVCRVGPWQGKGSPALAATSQPAVVGRP